MPTTSVGGNTSPQNSDALSQALIATAVDGIIVIDARGTVQVYNGACERLFGYRPDEIIGRNVKLLMPEPHQGEHDGYLSNYTRTRETRFIGIGREVVGRRKDGSTFPMYLSVGEGQSGGAPIFVGIIRDLTRLNAEIASREGANSLLAQIVQSSDDAILSKTLAGTIQTWNAAAQRIFGYTAAEAIGAHISILIPPDRLAEEAGIISRLRAGQDTRHFETLRRHKDGSDIPVSISISPLRDGAGQIVGAAKIMRDIGEKKRNEQRLQEAQAELLHVSRLSAMSHMSSALAHELNQPLTAIANYVKAARRTLDGAEADSVPRAQALIDKAASQVLRAGAIIRNLRDFIEKRESRRAPEDLANVIREAIALGLVGTADTNLKVHLDFDPTLASVLIDRIQIQQVLINLIRNAVEAMQAVEKRELTIVTQDGGDGCANVTVRDSGPGLPETVRQRLFQPFTTTKDKGMGIGLTICRSIVEAHGGSIAFLPDEQPGTAFRFRLPLVQQAEEETCPAAR